MIPSVESLFRHWKRACWVLDLWKQSDKNIMCPKPLSEYGWITTKDTLAIDWDSQSNMDAVRERVAGLLKGCACKTGYLTRQCGCQKKGKACGEGCDCMNCANTNINQTTTKIDDIDAIIEETLQEDLPHDIDEIMEWVFGEDVWEEVEDEYDEESDIHQN